MTGDVALLAGDCVLVMAALADCSVDAVVTDPPYGLEFMGKGWDGADGFRRSLNAADAGRDDVFGRTSRTGPEGWEHGFGETGYADARRLPRPNFGSSRNPMCVACHKHQRGADRCACPAPRFDERPADSNNLYQQWCTAWAEQCLRVLKPGGYLLAFGGTRTYHRLACAVEDAGFEIRDSLHWIYGSGFPKSLDVSKAIDKDAARWSGYGTALKPAHEPIVLARKPLAGTVAANVLEHGTGALNIDACRVGTADSLSGGAATKGSASHAEGWDRPWKNDPDAVAAHAARVTANVERAESLGRWPPNVVLSHADGCEPAGIRAVKGSRIGKPAAPTPDDRVAYGAMGAARPARGIGDADGLEIVEAWACAPGCPVAELDRQSGVTTSSGGAGAASTRTRGKSVYAGGLDQDVAGAHFGGVGDRGGASRFFPVFRYQAKAPGHERPRLADGTMHPTVKPVALMAWLVRLVTRRGGLVLDPFAGSGATGQACIAEGRRCVLIEQDERSAALIGRRLARPVQVSMFDSEQGGDGQ